MSASKMRIRQYLPQDETAVIELWRKCDLIRPQNNPQMDIERKLKVNPELFLVGLIDDGIVATAMAGYEGHRGWVNYVATDPEHRKEGLGRQIMKVVEEKLLMLGCPKINLQIRTNNFSAIDFYQKLGYKTDAVINLGKRLIEDD